MLHFIHPILCGSKFCVILYLPLKKAFDCDVSSVTNIKGQKQSTYGSWAAKMGSLGPSMAWELHHQGKLEFA